MLTRAEALGEPVWLGYAAWLRGDATGHLDRAAHYRRALAAAEALSSQLDDVDTLQACGMLHLFACTPSNVPRNGSAMTCSSASVDPSDIRRILEVVADLLRQARRDAGGRELRGLAWRRGVAPIG